ncbi:DegT/DnrJ/EryC1/StrS family aminotransferase, partial [Candidatus Pelagibacter sp.]|nr:DegT/DnrJ/EryC1/StrS family aminotransferase [Candidatus Pelagibacter sp.]
LLKVKHTVFTTSGSNALLLALNSLPLKKKSKVLIPNRTWVATAHAVYNKNFKLKVVDVDPSTMNFDLSFEKLKNKELDAVIIVNLNGRNAKFDNKIKTSSLNLIEDCAQSFLSFRGQNKLPNKVVSCYSTGVTKLLNTFQGGFCTTNNSNIYKKILLSRNHGVYDNFTDSWKFPGYNFKPTNLQCFIGIQELNDIWKKRSMCKKINELYVSKIKNNKIKIISTNYSKMEFPLYTLALVNNKSKFINFMKKYKIQIRPLPPSISSAKYLVKENIFNKFKNSKIFSSKGVYLPCGPSQNLVDINKVIKIANNY